MGRTATLEFKYPKILEPREMAPYRHKESVQMPFCGASIGLALVVRHAELTFQLRRVPSYELKACATFGSEGLNLTARGRGQQGGESLRDSEQLNCPMINNKTENRIRGSFFVLRYGGRNKRGKVALRP